MKDEGFMQFSVGTRRQENSMKLARSGTEELDSGLVFENEELFRCRSHTEFREFFLRRKNRETTARKFHKSSMKPA